MKLRLIVELSMTLVAFFCFLIPYIIYGDDMMLFLVLLVILVFAVRRSQEAMTKRSGK